MLQSGINGGLGERFCLPRRCVFADRGILPGLARTIDPYYDSGTIKTELSLKCLILIMRAYPSFKHS